jgi:hypothetical protein
MQVCWTSFQNTSHVNTTEYNTIQMYKFPKSAVLDIIKQEAQALANAL